MSPTEKEERIAKIRKNFIDPPTPPIDILKITGLLVKHFKKHTGVDVDVEWHGSLKSAYSSGALAAQGHPWHLEWFDDTRTYRYAASRVPGSNTLLTLLNEYDRSIAGVTPVQSATRRHVRMPSELCDVHEVFIRLDDPGLRNLEPIPMHPWLDDMLQLYEAGLAYFWVALPVIVVVGRPIVKLEGDVAGVTERQVRLHCPDGPAVIWPSGEQHYYLHGVHVPEYAVTDPSKITTDEITKELNVEVRRQLLQVYTPGRYLKDMGAKEVHKDAYGVLYRITQVGDEDLVMVKVVNSTPEPDGPPKEYFLRVPTWARTAREAVAWTFDIRADRYRPDMQT
jgi:hypothetical protein